MAVAGVFRLVSYLPKRALICHELLSPKLASQKEDRDILLIA
jgi:hypothetical protein